MQTIIDPMMQEATEALADNLLASEALVHYQQARARLDEDRQARGLLEQLSRAQADLRKKQGTDGVTEAEIEALRALQEQVQHNTVIMTFAQTQQEAVNFLREINAEINELLGINFASFAKHASCC